MLVVQKLLRLSIDFFFLSFTHSLACRVCNLAQEDRHHNEEHDDVADSHREGWHEKVINLVLEGNTEEPEEQEIGGRAHDVEECTDAVVSVVLEGKYAICYENAYSINEHTCTPESNILAIRLMGSLLGKNPEAAVEDEGSVDEGVGEPLDEEPG